MVTNAVVLYDPEFAAGQVRSAWYQVTVSINAMADSIVEGFWSITGLMRDMGFVPPPAAGSRHGERWTSCVGYRLRVAGRRGRPETYHWIPAGPRRWRAVP